jgi:hypothetical protein
MMSWLVFWINPGAAAPQFSIAVTSMLTLIAYRFAVGAELPKLPYLTRLDTFILMSSVLIFASLLEVVYTTQAAAAGKPEAAISVDRKCRWLFPIGFVLATAAIFFG